MRTKEIKEKIKQILRQYGYEYAEFPRKLYVFRRDEQGRLWCCARITIYAGKKEIEITNLYDYKTLDVSDISKIPEAVKSYPLRSFFFLLFMYSAIAFFSWLIISFCASP